MVIITKDKPLEERVVTDNLVGQITELANAKYPLMSNPHVQRILTGQTRKYIQGLAVVSAPPELREYYCAGRGWNDWSNHADYNDTDDYRGDHSDTHTDRSK